MPRPPSSQPSAANTNTLTTLFSNLSSRTGSALLVVLSFTLPLFFLGLNWWGFFDPDEGRYAEIPREMIARGDFITPTLNYVHYFEKPPLLYWLTAGFFKLFGFHEWAARLSTALPALLGVLIVYGVGRRMFGPRTGLLGAIILATCLEWVILARELLIDMPLATAMFAANAFWWLGHTDSGARRRGYFLAFWVTLACAVLLKGPVAVVLVGASIFVYLCFSREWRSLRSMQWLPGLVLFFILTAPWFILVAQRNPTFNHFFWYEQHILRFTGGGGKAEHVKPVYYFFEFLPLLLFPWSVCLPGAVAAIWSVKSRWLKPQTPRQRAGLYLLINAAIIVVFFSISTGKLLTYVLPAIPPLALLIAAYLEWLAEQPRSAKNRWLVVAGIILLVILVAILIVGITIGKRKLWEMEALEFTIALPLCTAVALWIVGVLVATGRKSVGLFTAATGVGFWAFFLCALPIIARAAPNHNSLPLLTYIRPGLERDGEVVFMETYMQSIGFYTQKRLVYYRLEEIRPDKDGVLMPVKTDEINPGRLELSSAEAERWFPLGMNKLRTAMARSTPLYVVVSDHSSAEQTVSELGDGAAVITYNKRRAIIGNAAAAKITPPQPGGYTGRGIG